MAMKAWAAQTALAVAALLGGHAVQAAQVVVGQVAPLSGLEASQGRAYATGMQLYFNAVNKAGGVGGHTFTLVKRDDAGRPDDTVNHTQAMLAEDRPAVL